MKIKLIIIFLLFFINLYGQNKLRIGVLAYGTVNWELDVLKHNQFDKKNGFELEVLKLASKNAQAVALQSGDVDIIVTDWIWVNRQRANKKDFTFYPYSKASGTMMIDSNSTINNLMDLKGKNLGIAGGPLDKSWLLFRAYCKNKYNIDLKDLTNPLFASAPIVYEKMLSNSFDAAINFWHFNAKLEAKGMKPLITMKDLLKELGIENDIAFVGWTFNREFASKNKELINSFLNASLDSKKLLDTNEKEWDRIKPIMNVKDDKSFEALKNGYKDGIIKHFDENNIDSFYKIFNILLQEGGEKLVGSSTTLEKETFWKFNSSKNW